MDTTRIAGADLHRAAIDHLQRGDAAAAVAAARAAAAATVDLELLNDLGVITAEAAGPDAARPIFEAVLAIDGAQADARENLAALDAQAPAVRASWRDSATLGGPDPLMPERAFPGMPGAGVMREHALRYAFCLDLVAGRDVLDLGCGTGYGSEILSWTAARVRGFDLWTPESHERPRWPGGARLTYGHDLCADPLPAGDVAVAFEVVEHLADAPRALRLAWGAVDVLVVSFPNPVFHGSHHNPYHVNDWTLDEVESRIAEAASGRFGTLELTHFRQDHRDGSGGMILPGRDPEASYWIIVAAASR
ncbi:MAG TPA: methyltransferase domain-containing protein [Miltoncostaeaceae bacterium]|nr:methyltransferase domain-containing protein [Miltoncostaeaceae bacterium]